jgi:hypothetical protein
MLLDASADVICIDLSVTVHWMFLSLLETPVDLDAKFLEVLVTTITGNAQSYSSEIRNLSMNGKNFNCYTAAGPLRAITLLSPREILPRLRADLFGSLTRVYKMQNTKYHTMNLLGSQMHSSSKINVRG